MYNDLRVHLVEYVLIFLVYKCTYTMDVKKEGLGNKVGLDGREILCIA